MESRTINDFSKIERYFDHYIEWDKRLAFEIPFLVSLLEKIGARTVLDVGCGSGRHVAELLKRGFDAVGLDPSVHLLDTAAEICRRLGVEGEFVMGSAIELNRESGGILGQGGALDGRSFDACIALGNIFPLIHEPELILKSLKCCHYALAKGGILISHMPNYAKKIAERDKSMRFREAIIDEAESMLIKTLQFIDRADGGKPDISMHMLVLIPDGDTYRFEDNTVPLYPILPDEFGQLLRSAEFDEVEFYGSMGGEIFDIQASHDLVTVAAKK